MGTILDATAAWFAGDPTVQPDASSAPAGTPAPANGTGFVQSTLQDIQTAANVVYTDVLTPLGHAVAAAAQIPGKLIQSSENVGGSLSSFAQALPWILIGLAVLAVIFFFFKPQVISSVLGFFKG